MRIAVLSDIHSNILALDAVLSAAGTVDAVWHLGDVVGYGPEPDAVVARLREIGATGVKGNHDAAAPADRIDWFTDARRAMDGRTTSSPTAPLRRAPVRSSVTGRSSTGPAQLIWEYVTSSRSRGRTAVLEGHSFGHPTRRRSSRRTADRGREPGDGWSSSSADAGRS
jgi:hypothetical protein